MKFVILNLLVCIFFTFQVKGQDSTTNDPVKPLKTITGIASFYSSNLQGTETATGEIYEHKKLTAASNNFKLNTWVKVTNLRNHKSVIVRINDRMNKRMSKKGRVIDLSRIAAQKLQFMKMGLVKVKVEELPNEPTGLEVVNIN